MVEQGQTTGSRQKMVFSGISRANRLTRLISVPTAQIVPGGRLANGFDDYFGRAVEVAGAHHVQRAFGMHDHLTPG